jgi:excisionase family DNA binding protein
MVAAELEGVTPSLDDVEVAKAAMASLPRLLHGGERVGLRGGDEREVVELPSAAVALIGRVLAALAAGHAVAVIPIHAELTTQEAADLLGVSRPFLVKELERGAIPYRKVGSHRRVRYGDLAAYKRRAVEEGRRTLAELARQGQEIDGGE